jgi:hypothetical protein
MRRLNAMVVTVLMLSISVRARAEGEGQSAPPPPNDPNAPPQQPAQPEPGDAWDQAMRAGIKQEGRQTKDQLIQKEKDEEQQANSAEDVRKQLRFGAFLGLGGMVGLEHSLQTIGEVQPGGVEFQVGAGVRKGFTLEWEFQGRALFTAYNVGNPKNNFYSGSSSSNTSFPISESNPGLGMSFDGTARYHFAGITKPFYFGFGARLDFIGLSGTHETTKSIGSTPVQKAKTSTSLLTVAPLGVAEIGVVLMDAQRVDLSVRMAAGLGFHMGAMAGVAF